MERARRGRERLESMAAAAKGLSLNALVVRELSEVSCRAGNAAPLEGLPDLGLDMAEVVDVIREGRGER